MFKEPADYSKRMLLSYALYLTKKFAHPADKPSINIDNIKIYRVTHSIITPGDMSRGENALDPTLYYPYFMGSFDKNANLINPNDPFLYQFSISEEDDIEALQNFYEYTLATQIFHSMLQNAASEQSSRMNAMENASNPFGSQHIKDCIKQLSKEPVAFYGIDLAKSVDWSVIIGLDRNGDVAYFDRFQKDWKQTKETIMELDRSKPVLIDSTGVGDAITEDLQKGFNHMEGFKYTSTSKQQLMESTQFFKIA
jgi:hypothetical protein